MQRAEVQERSVPGGEESMRIVEARHGSLVQRGSPSWNRGEAERRGRVEDGGKRGRRSVKATADISARGIRRRELERFIQSVEKLPEMVTEFDEALWGSLVDHLTVNAKDDIVFTMASGMEIKAI